jgi:hypothetical protein
MWANSSQEAALPDAGLTDHPDNLGVPLEGLLQGRVQRRHLVAAPNHA